MDPFRKVVKTEEEKRALIAVAKKEWDALDPTISHLVASSEEDYLSRIADGIEVEKEVFVPARELTATELAKQNGELMFSQMYGDRADDKYSSVPALAAMEKAQERGDFEKLVGRARPAETWLEELVRQAITKVQTVPRRASDRSELGIVPRMAAASEGDNSDVARFVRAFVAGDEDGMRQVARELASAAA